MIILAQPFVHLLSSVHNLEKTLGNCTRAVEIRRYTVLIIQDNILRYFDHSYPNLDAISVNRFKARISQDKAPTAAS